MISIICALDNNRGIGKNGQLPWRISQDLKYFKELTKGNCVIMGRKTYESIGWSLSDRVNIVITRDPDYLAEGCFVVNSVETALEKAKSLEKEKTFVIGGGEIYKLVLPFSDKLYLTLIDGNYDADTFFPDYSEFKKIISDSGWQKENNIKYKFLELER
jgi:dihydrofolate reductase